MTQEFVRGQIRRMASLDGFPAFYPEAVGELVIFSAKHGRSEEHLTGVIDKIMSEWTKCPKPCELRTLLDVGKPQIVKLDCPECEGSGWRMHRNGGAERCPCGSRPLPPSDDIVYDKREKPAKLKEFLKIKQ